MAPVRYMPAATIKSTPMVSIPGLEKPRRLSSKGARPKVMLRVKAPRKTATGGIRVAINNTKARVNSAKVR